MRASSLVAVLVLVVACGPPDRPVAPETPGDAGADSATSAVVDAAAVDAAPKLACAKDQGDGCREACIAGKIAECSWYVAAASADPEEKVRRAVVSCEASVGHSPEEAILMCTFAGTACWDPPEGGGCTRMLNAVCAISLLASECRRPALVKGRSTYDPERAAKVLDAIASCKGPDCSYSEITLAEPGVVSKELKLRVAQRIEERCAATEKECDGSAYWVLDPRAEHFDAARAARVADNIDKMCTTGTEDICLSVFFARTVDGPAPKPARAFEVADKRCTNRKKKDSDECSLLAICYAEGRCGKPKDVKRGLALYERDCQAILAQMKGWTRAEPAACRKADELKKK